MTIYDKFFVHTRELFCVLTPDGHFKHISPSWKEQLGWDDEDLQGKSLLEFIHVSDKENFSFFPENAVSSVRPPLRSIRFLHKNTNFHWLSWSFTEAPADRLIFAVARDITHLRKNNLSLEALVASLDDMIFLIDETAIFIELWTSNQNLIGKKKEEILGKRIRDVFGYFGVGIESVLQQSLKLNKSLSIEFQLPDNPSWFSAKVTPVSNTTGDKRMASFLIRDISDRIESDLALDQERGRLLASSKMATLGEMAAGIAHEINNPLAIIQGKAWLLRNQLDSEDLDLVSLKADLQTIHETTDRISKIIHGLRTFSRNADGDPFEETTVAKVIEDSLQLCQEKFRHHGIEIRVVSRKPCQLQCRSIQISQILLNLLSNSFDAIEGTETPWVEIHVTDLQQQVEIAVIDSGAGILPAVQEKLSQPFFTTKEVGKGTGLGLSITKGIVEGHHGEFYYDKSSVNTKFVLRLPKKQNGERQKLPA